ncbi:biopolymer transporter ExbD [Calothrix sp. PCC 7507]|uniref:ExbD/TolR family protein n=1 Tax=Calothrix sp. PCC 7507 TaxID=99598 RepID=UPI00029EE66C|nr:biopolymer transporter ExbD [Calothrix sp. PCC 7507]AFY34197.1 Biopolymer transport protein ExbD/TolR [Calothrix sp. PCC 7507]
MKINQQSPSEEVQIQIIPLIDVVFCILTFFLLASVQLTRQAINIELPKASTGTAAGLTSQGKGNILPVTIDAVGQTYVEKQVVQRGQLAEILKKYVQENPTGTLVLNASRTATYNDVVQTLDLLRQVGGDRVSLGIIPGQDQPSTTPNIPIEPSFPVNPGVAPVVPNTVPVPGTNPQDNINPTLPLPTEPNQSQPGQGIIPNNPGVSPVVPNAPAPQAPLAPGKKEGGQRR